MWPNLASSRTTLIISSTTIRLSYYKIHNISIGKTMIIHSINYNNIIYGIVYATLIIHNIFNP